MPANAVDFTGGFYLDYDGQHHVLYSSSWGNGVWRMVTQ
jgi:hypothetical protein